jgi:hypothetical protein
MGKHGKKDPKKVRAGRLGGQKSGGNFKHNKQAATMAGRRSAWKRQSGKLEDFPLGLIDDNGREVPFPVDSTEKRRRARV